MLFLMEINALVFMLCWFFRIERNGNGVQWSEEELIALGLGIASGKIEEKDIGIWIVKHNRGEWVGKYWGKGLQLVMASGGIPRDFMALFSNTLIHARDRRNEQITKMIYMQ